MNNKDPEIIFEIGQLYRNRIGLYRVLKIMGDKIYIEYLDTGKFDNLSIDLQKRIIANLTREQEIPGIIDKDRETFFAFVDECNNNYRSGHDLGLYKKIIDKHRNSNGIDPLLDSDDFFILVWDTLEAWNMNQRGAQLTSVEKLRESIRSHRSILRSLYFDKLYTIVDPQIDASISKRLHDLFCGLQVMESRRRIVGVSKTIHFLLPDLVIPIDGAYTLPYFFGYNKYDTSDESEFYTFEYIFQETYKIARRLNLTNADVNSNKWNTSVPKLIDDAIIGCFKRYGL